MHLGLEMAQRQCRIPPFWSLPVFRCPYDGADGTFDRGNNVSVGPLAALPDI